MCKCYWHSLLKAFVEQQRNTVLWDCYRLVMVPELLQTCIVIKSFHITVLWNCYRHVVLALLQTCIVINSFHCTATVELL